MYDGSQIIGTLNEQGEMLETYTRDIGILEDVGTLVAITQHAGSDVNTSFYLHQNHRADIVLTRSATATVGVYDYSAFGSLRSQTGTDVCRFKFSSKEREASCGLTYYGHRFYAASWQRWLNPDRVETEDGENLYPFVRNAPVVFVDPSGQFAAPIGGIVIKKAVLGCIKGAILSALADLVFQYGKECYKQVGWQLWKCDLKKCPPPNWCSVAVSSVVGCVAGAVFPTAPPVTLEGLKLLLAKWAGSSGAKLLAKLPCK